MLRNILLHMILRMDKNKERLLNMDWIEHKKGLA